MAKGQKFEIIRYQIMCVKTGKFVVKPCSHKFCKESKLNAYLKKYRAKYEKKYASKTINGIKFGKDIDIYFTIGRIK